MKYSPLLVVKAIADVERERNHHTIVFRIDISIRKVRDPELSVPVPLFTGKYTKAHKILESEILTCLMIIKPCPGNISWPRQRIV